MTSTFRIPPAPLTGPLARAMTAYARRVYGQVPDNAQILWHNRPVLKAVLGFERKVSGWKGVDPHLKTYAVMAAAGSIGCSWCLDFGYFMAHTDGLDLAKVREVPRWRESAVFSGLERDVMAYAEAMTSTPPTVTDAQVGTLVNSLGAPALVELTQMVALENMRSRFNFAAGLESQGFSAVCDVPLTTASDPVPG